MLRDSLKKFILFGLVAGLTLSGATAQAMRDNDDDDDDDGDDETPELVVRGDGCDGNENSGLSLIQLCGTAIPLNLLNLGENEQGILFGLLGDDDGDDGDGDGDGDGCENENSGTSVLQSCNLAILANILNLGESEQVAVLGGGDEGDEDDGDGDCSNSNSGLSLIQLCNTAIPLNILNLGENSQFAATP